MSSNFLKLMSFYLVRGFTKPLQDSRRIRLGIITARRMRNANLKLLLVMMS